MWPFSRSDRLLQIETFHFYIVCPSSHVESSVDTLQKQKQENTKKSAVMRWCASIRIPMAPTKMPDILQKDENHNVIKPNADIYFFQLFACYVLFGFVRLYDWWWA